MISTSILFVVVLAAFIGAATWLVARDRLSRLGAFLIITALSALLPALASLIASAIVQSGFTILLLLCNFMITIPAISGFKCGSPLAMVAGWAIQSAIMGAIGFYIWSGMENIKRMRTTT